MWVLSTPGERARIRAGVVFPEPEDLVARLAESVGILLSQVRQRGLAGRIGLTGLHSSGDEGVGAPDDQGS